MKKLLCLLLSVISMLSLVACGNDAATSDTPTPPVISSKPVEPPALESTEPPEEPSNAGRIGELIDILAMNPEEKALWVNPAEATELIAYGDESLSFMFSAFEQGESDTARAEVMLGLCRMMLTGEDVNLQASGPDMWYLHFKERVIRLRNLNTADEMRVMYPQSSVLLTVLGIPEDAPIKSYPPVEIPDHSDFDPAERLKDNEVVLFNGVRLGMTMDEVLAIIGEDVEFFSPAFIENRTFTYDGISYGCSKYDGDDEFRLRSVSFLDDSHSSVRGIRFGDTIDSVFDRFPVRDRVLKKWEWQMLYGELPEGDGPHRNYAALEFVAMSYYSMRVLSENYYFSLMFSRVEQRVIYISLMMLSS